MRLSPLCSNAATTVATSAGLRRRRSVCFAGLSMLPVHHPACARESMPLPEWIQWIRDGLRKLGGSGQRNCATHVENEQNRPLGLQNCDWPCARMNPAHIAMKPAFGRRNVGRTRHLRMDKHRIEWRVHPESSNGSQQISISRTRGKLSATWKSSSSARCDSSASSVVGWASKLRSSDCTGQLLHTTDGRSTLRTQAFCER